MVDTAAPWCILKPSLGKIVRPHLEELPGEVTLSTRVGRIEGSLFCGPVTLVADEGDTLTIGATFFLSSDWPGGNFVGYQGFLDRLRFAFDTGRNLFYFDEHG